MSEFAVSKKSGPDGNLMSDSAVSLMSDSAVSLSAILFTEELYRRPTRRPDYAGENRALVKLTQALADSPHTILQTLADMLLEVFDAGSAGISLLTAEDRGKRFYWPAIAGKWKPHIGGGSPRDFGPCGDVLDRNRPLLFRHIEKRYTYFKPVTPPVEECLFVPFHSGGKAVGTIWVVAHDHSRQFDAEDERLMTSLATFASSAYHVTTSIDALRFQAAVQQNQHIQELSRRLLHAEDEERRHIARELHDSTGQKMAVLLMDLAKARRQEGSLPGRTTTLSECLTLATEVSDELRSLSYVLHPPLLDELGLIIALQIYAEGINKRHMLQVSLDVGLQTPRLSPDMEIALFRVIQAALANVHAHSGSKKATVRIVQDTQKLVVEIVDQGCGMKAADGPLTVKGVGLLGIQERLHLLGGRLEVESGIHGTTLRAIVPLI